MNNLSNIIKDIDDSRIFSDLIPKTILIFEDVKRIHIDTDSEHTTLDYEDKKEVIEKVKPHISSLGTKVIIYKANGKSQVSKPLRTAYGAYIELGVKRKMVSLV